MQNIGIFGNSQGYFGHLIDHESTNFQVLIRGESKEVEIAQVRSKTTSTRLR